MDCRSFSIWLENRDIYDLSEADKAHRHAEQCDKCSVLLLKDQSLDKRLRDVFSYEPSPDTLSQYVRKTIESPAGKHYQWRNFFAIPALIALSLVIFFVLQPSKNSVAIELLGRSVVFDHRDHGNPDAGFEKIEDIRQWSGRRLRDSFALEGMVKNTFTVIGGKICTINNCNFAHLLLHGEKGYSSLFVTSAQDISCRLVSGKVYSVYVEGQNVRLWKKEEMVYLLVS